MLMADSGRKLKELFDNVVKGSKKKGQHRTVKNRMRICQQNEQSKVGISGDIKSTQVSV